MSENEPNQDRAIGRLEGKVDLILDHLTEKDAADAAAHALHTKRIGALERKWAWATGVGTALGGISGYIASLIHGAPK